MAHSDSDVKHVSQLLKEAQSLVSESSNVLQDGVARASLLRVCRNLTLAVEEPDELVSNVAFSGGRNMCVRVADDLKMFDLIAERPRTSHELAELTGADEILIIRIMRTLVATGFAAQDGKLTYSATLGTKQLVLPSVRAGVRCMWVSALASYQNAESSLGMTRVCPSSVPCRNTSRQTAIVVQSQWWMDHSNMPTGLIWTLINTGRLNLAPWRTSTLLCRASSASHAADCERTDQLTSWQALRLDYHGGSGFQSMRSSLMGTEKRCPMSCLWTLERARVTRPKHCSSFIQMSKAD